MTRTKKLILLFSVMALCMIMIVGIVFAPTEKASVSYEEPEKEIQSVSVNIKAVGDNLIHSPIYKSCKTDDGYDFSGLYENIKSFIKDADIRAINQETIFIGDEERFSGYPAFGSPCEVGRDAYRAGFNLVTQANNHSYDKGIDGITYTMDFWENYDDITLLGVNRSKEEQNKIAVFKKGDLKIALMNFTYGLNGFRLPQDKKYLVNILERSEENKSLIEKACSESDVQVVFLHFGTEYTHTPTEEQKRDVEFLSENGIDVIIGSHPHVIEPVTEYINENGNKTVVFYSLGNFISNQSGVSKILGGMADVTIKKENGVSFVESYRMLPTVTHVEGGKYTAYMLKDYTDALAGKNSRSPNLTVEKLQSLFDEVMNLE